MLTLRVAVHINRIEIDVGRTEKSSAPVVEARGRHPSGGGVVTDIDTARTADERPMDGRSGQLVVGITPRTELLIDDLRDHVRLAMRVVTVSGVVAYRLLEHASLLVFRGPPAAGAAGDRGDDTAIGAAGDTASVVRALHPYYRSNVGALNPSRGVIDDYT